MWQASNQFPSSPLPVYDRTDRIAWQTSIGIIALLGEAVVVAGSCALAVDILDWCNHPHLLWNAQAGLAILTVVTAIVLFADVEFAVRWVQRRLRRRGFMVICPAAGNDRSHP